MHSAGAAGHHARWRSCPEAFLEAGAAIRTLVARLVTGVAGRPTHRPPTAPLGSSRTPPSHRGAHRPSTRAITVNGRTRQAVKAKPRSKEAS
jgi:hypothetical protein